MGTIEDNALVPATTAFVVPSVPNHQFVCIFSKVSFHESGNPERKYWIPASAEILRRYIILRFQSHALDEFERMG
jgi:hypothetical protein